MLSKYRKYGLGWVSTALDVVNTGANVYSSIKGSNNSSGGGQTVNHTTVVERQLTPEEIKIKQEQHAEWLKQQQYNRAIKIQKTADMRRVITGNFGAKPEKDNTILYITGGVIALGLIVLLVKK
ncbi:hypothetical protein [Capnocytophaga cynodegmi]|uniref:Uncharacterized protein n=1 Tax=Capnocytophaga cynodegmi TaxID=28189 RepID=A0A0B7H5K9_9FLAO|nr:hypothetical protein [Capnocytophaga cynodegmi]CEN34916.1 hypothetical protein CCYN2B_240020 [Capnocytophaga cynodegmi]